MANTNVTSGGISFFGLLCILFIALKLTGYIHWSWFWILFPITIPITIIVLIFAGCFIAVLYEHYNKRQRQR